MQTEEVMSSVGGEDGTSCEERLSSMHGKHFRRRKLKRDNNVPITTPLLTSPVLLSDGAPQLAALNNDAPRPAAFNSGDSQPAALSGHMQKLRVLGGAPQLAVLDLFTNALGLPGLHAIILSCLHHRHGNHIHRILHRDIARLRQCSKSVWTISWYDTIWLSKLRCGCCCNRCECHWLRDGWICRALWVVA